MTDMRSECSRMAAVIVGSLSFIGSIISMVPVGISLNEYLSVPYRKNAFPEVALQTFLLLHACSSVLMICGAIKGRPVMMLPWLGTFIGAIIASLAMSVGVVINYVVFLGWGHDMVNYAISIAVAWASTAAEILFCAIVYHHYNKLISGKVAESSLPQTLNEPIIKSNLMYQKA